ncbi:hypothetical protein DL93DRAFT_2085204 [Clavulina sp. PMI_390]|nr:hypothetical protein DL93DRAFT_2085204 [Clavulina sp. PMI_390]
MPSVETLEIRHCSERMWPSIGVEILLPNLQSVLVETYDITGTNSLRELVSFIFLYERKKKTKGGLI